MADFAAIYSPASASGGISDNQQITNLAAGTASATLTIGYRYKIAISVVPGTTSGATAGAAVRFSVGSAVAASTDFVIPLNNVLAWDMGYQFNSVSFYNLNGTGTLTISVMRLTT
jgi:hypothetical protein